jgi:hypothetical protein
MSEAIAENLRDDVAGGHPDPSIWRVTAWLWTREEPEATEGSGLEIETLEVSDRELAIAAAHLLLDRYAKLASPVAEVDVSLTGPLAFGPGGVPPGPSLKYGSGLVGKENTCLSS